MLQFIEAMNKVVKEIDSSLYVDGSGRMCIRMNPCGQLVYAFNIEKVFKRMSKAEREAAINLFTMEVYFKEEMLEDLSRLLKKRKKLETILEDYTYNNSMYEVLSFKDYKRNIRVAYYPQKDNINVDYTGNFDIKKLDFTLDTEYIKSIVDNLVNLLETARELYDVNREISKVSSCNVD